MYSDTYASLPMICNRTKDTDASVVAQTRIEPISRESGTNLPVFYFKVVRPRAAASSRLAFAADSKCTQLVTAYRGSLTCAKLGSRCWASMGKIQLSHRSRSNLWRSRKGEARLVHSLPNVFHVDISAAALTLFSVYFCLCKVEFRANHYKVLISYHAGCVS